MLLYSWSNLIVTGTYASDGNCIFGCMQAVSSKLDEMAQAEPTERQSHLGETEHDHDYEEPPAKSSKSSKPAYKRGKSGRISKSAGKQQADNQAQEGESAEDNDSSGGSHMEQDNDRKNVAQKSSASRDGLSPAGLAWPKRPPRDKRM